MTHSPWGSEIFVGRHRPVPVMPCATRRSSALPGCNRTLLVAEVMERLHKPLPHLLPIPWGLHLPCRALAAPYDAGNDSKRRVGPSQAILRWGCQSSWRLSVKAHRFRYAGTKFSSWAPATSISSGTHSRSVRRGTWQPQVRQPCSGVSTRVGDTYQLCVWWHASYAHP